MEATLKRIVLVMFVAHTYCSTNDDDRFKRHINKEIIFHEKIPFGDDVIIKEKRLNFRPHGLTVNKHISFGGGHHHDDHHHQQHHQQQQHHEQHNNGFQQQFNGNFQQQLRQLWKPINQFQEDFFDQQEPKQLLPNLRPSIDSKIDIRGGPSNFEKTISFNSHQRSFQDPGFGEDIIP